VDCAKEKVTKCEEKTYTNGPMRLTLSRKEGGSVVSPRNTGAIKKEREVLRSGGNSVQQLKKV